MKKYTKVAAGETATHVEKDATFFEAVNPFGPPVDVAGGTLRAAVVGLATFSATSKIKTGSWY